MDKSSSVTSGSSSASLVSQNLHPTSTAIVRGTAVDVDTSRGSLSSAVSTTTSSTASMSTDVETSVHESRSTREGSSAATTSTLAFETLPFVKGLRSWGGFACYRLKLDLDLIIEHGTIQTAFGPIVEASNPLILHSTLSNTGLSGSQQGHTNGSTPNGVTPNGTSNGGPSNGGAPNGISSGRPSNGRPSNGGASNGGASNGGASNGGASNGGASNGGASNGGASNSGAPSGISNGRPSNGRPSNGRPSNGRPSNGRPSNGGAHNGIAPNGVLPNGTGPNGPHRAGSGRRSPNSIREECEEYPKCPPPTPVSPCDRPETFRNAFFEVQSSLLAGFGAFALKNLKWSQTILVEKALFHADRQTLFDELDRLTPSLKQAYYRMHAHSSSLAPNQGKAVSIFATNSFNTSRSGRIRSSVFLTAARFNHACKTKNNVVYVYDRHHDAIVLSVNQDVQAGEELTIDYGKDPAGLFVDYGFVCRCGGCTPLTKAQVASLKNPPVRW